MNEADDLLRLRIAELEDEIFQIASIADGHKTSLAYDENGMNIALCVVLARAAAVLGRSNELKSRGTLLASAVDTPVVDAGR